jgi:hypothetical protein
MGGHPRITHLPDGTPIADLVARLRAQKDLTIRERCADVGLNPDRMTDYQLVWRVCRSNGLATRPMSAEAMAERKPKPVRPATLRVKEAPPRPGLDEAALRLAKQELSRQIALARQEMATAPAYLGGEVDW